MSTNPMPRDRAVEALWAGVRLAVIDLETTYQKEHGTKIVSVALVTCRAGRIQGSWSALVNPGIHIRREDTRIHGLRDEDVAGAPAFAEVAGTLTPALVAQPDERLIVVAHNTAFDVPVLRRELEAAGQQIPDLPALDTMGSLTDLAELTTSSKSLESLLEALGLHNDNPHDALADATATAKAVCELLARAAERGHLDIDRLLAYVGATTTLNPAAGGGGSRDDTVAAPALPETHLATHVNALNARPAARTVARWTAALEDCATLRCSHAAGRVQAAAAPADTLMPAITTALTNAVSNGDGPGAATLLDAAATALEGYGHGMKPRPRRAHALALYQQWAALLAGVERCDKDLCPACREGRPCGVDTWTYHLAGAAVGQWTKSGVGSFMPFTGTKARTGHSVWSTWTREGHGPIADAALWRCYQWWIDNNQGNSAHLMAQVAWNAGARHPRLAQVYLDSIAAAGRPADLAAALAVADTALATQPRLGPPEHWRALQARRTWLAGQISRGTTRYTGELDTDGNPIPVRRHHPDQPKRTRPARFLRHYLAQPDEPDTGQDRRGTLTSVS